MARTITTRVPNRALRACTLTLVVLLCAAGCGGEDDSSGGAPEELAASRAAPRPQRFPLFEFSDDRGGRFGLERLVGCVWLAAFVSGDRGLAADGPLAALQAVGGDVPGAESVRLIVFWGDAPPNRGDAKFSDRLAGMEATLLTGERDEVALLHSEILGAPRRERAAGDAVIASDVFLLDRRGRIRARADLRTEAGLAVVGRLLPELLQDRRAKPMVSPRDTLDQTWLRDRARMQRAASATWRVRHQFQFVDRRRASGIQFIHRCVDDAGVDYKPVHYDHGCGVAIADVDGDGRHDLYFSNQVGSNQLWRNLGGGRFEDMTTESGLAVRDPCGVTASFADTDNDGDPDLYVTTVRGGNLLFENDGKGRFTDVTVKAGLSYTGHSSAGVFFDYDRDGRLDLFLCNVGVYTTDRVRDVRDDATTSGQEPGPFQYYDGHPDAFSGHLREERLERSILYRNLGGNRFADVTAAMELTDTSWTGDATPIDANDDGWIDLYVCNMQGHDEYYENVGGTRFRKRSREIFPRTPWGTMGVKLFDFDGDDRLDLYLTDMHSDMSQAVQPEEESQKSNMTWPESLTRSGGMSIFGNAFFRRVGPNRLVEISDRIGAENYWPWGISVGDLNADGRDDVFVTASMNFPYRYGTNLVLLNDGGRRFVNAEFVLGVEPRRGALRKPWFELDGMDARDQTHRLCDPSYTGIVSVWAPLGSRSSVIFDLDDDGDLDIVTNDMNSAPLVLVSDLAQVDKLSFLKIRLRGTKSNRDGLGSLVRVRAGGRTQLKVHDGQSGYLSQSSQLLYFGLGEATSVDRVEVTWPSGKRQVVAAPKPLNRILEIVEE